MENSNPIIVGLDIGTTKIACFIGQRAEGGKLRILGYGKTDSVGVEHGVVKNILLTAQSIGEAVNAASDQAGVNVHEVYVGIAGQHIKSIQSQGSIMVDTHPIITEDDLNRLKDEQSRMMLTPGEQIIHVIPQTYIVDGEELSPEISPIGVAGKKLTANFHIVTGNMNNIRNINEAVRRAGLRVCGVVLEPIASSYAVLSDLDREAGVALVDIGGGTTDIAIFQDGIIRHTSVLAMAGNSITKDILNGCNVLKNQAESLKIKFGSCLPESVSEDDIISIPGFRGAPPREITQKTLANIIKGRTQMLFEEVNYDIQLSGLEKRLIGGVVITGGGAKLRNICDLASFITHCDTRIGTPNEHLVNGSKDELAHPMYATGIGLVLYGLEQSEHKRKYNDEGWGANFPDESEQEPEPEKTVEQTIPDPEPEPEPEIIPEKDKEKKKNREIGKKVGDWLKKAFTQNIDEDDE